MGRLYSISVIFIFVISLFLIYYVASDLVNSLPDLIGKDITFSGRTDLWTDIVREINKNPLMGCGFQGFWVMENVNVFVMNETYNMLLKSAHNGYLDILNETGLIGLLLLAAAMIYYFMHSMKLNKPNFWTWFIIAALILNLQESTLFRQGLPVGFIFMFAYFHLFAELIDQRQYEHVS